MYVHVYANSLFLLPPLSLCLAVSEIVQVVVLVSLQCVSLSLTVGIVSIYVCVARCLGERSARRIDRIERGSDDSYPHTHLDIMYMDMHPVWLFKI